MDDRYRRKSIKRSGSLPSSITRLLNLFNVSVVVGTKTVEHSSNEESSQQASRRQCAEYIEGYEFTSQPDAYREDHISAYVDCLQALRSKPSKRRRTFVGGVHYPTIVTRHHGPPVMQEDMALIDKCEGEEHDFEARCCAARNRQCWKGFGHFWSVCCGLPRGPNYIFITPALDVNVGSRLRNQGTFIVAQSYAMQALLEPGDVVVDAGANIGAYTVPFAVKVGPQGTVYAFEPFRRLFQLVCANVAANGLGNVHAVHAALGKGEERLRVRSPDLSTFNLPSSMQVRNQGYSQDARNWTLYYEPNAWEEVVIMSLDSLHLSSLKLLKIDVEDMETEVIAGAAVTLQRLRPLVWAENAKLFEKGDTSFVIAMESLGYVCSPLVELEWEILCEHNSR